MTVDESRLPRTSNTPRIECMVLDTGATRSGRPLLKLQQPVSQLRKRGGTAVLYTAPTFDRGDWLFHRTVGYWHDSVCKVTQLYPPFGTITS